MQDKKKVYLILGIVIVLMSVLETLFAHPHHHRLWNVVPGADIWRCLAFDFDWQGHHEQAAAQTGELLCRADGGQCGSKSGGVLACGKAPRKDFEAESRWQA